jgi:hypothetical protein
MASQACPLLWVASIGSSPATGICRIPTRSSLMSPPKGFRPRTGHWNARAAPTAVLGDEALGSGRFQGGGTMVAAERYRPTHREHGPDGTSASAAPSSQRGVGLPETLELVRWQCQRCGCLWSESSEDLERLSSCPQRLIGSCFLGHEAEDNGEAGEAQEMGGIPAPPARQGPAASPCRGGKTVRTGSKGGRMPRRPGSGPGDG